MGFAEDIAAERAAQDAKWGRQRHAWGDWMAVLGEEYGEACAAALELIWNDQGGPVGKLTRWVRLRDELVQIAAVAAAIVEHLDEEVERFDGEVAAIGPGGDDDENP